MAPVFPTGYVRLFISMLVSGGTDTTFTVRRSTFGPITPDNPGDLIASDLPLLNQQAVFIDDSVPIGVTVWWTVDGNAGGQNTFSGQQTTGIGFMWLKDVCARGRTSRSIPATPRRATPRRGAS